MTERSASARTGWYRQPPSLFWVSTMSWIDAWSFSRISGRRDIPYASARKRAPKPCEYIGPCVPAFWIAMKPEGVVLSIT